MVQVNTLRPPKRSVRRPNGMRPRLPNKTGMAMAILACTGARWNCFLSTGIMAETEPKTAKHSANAPVPRINCHMLERLEVKFMGQAMPLLSSADGLTGCDKNHT